MSDQDRIADLERRVRTLEEVARSLLDALRNGNYSAHRLREHRKALETPEERTRNQKADGAWLDWWRG